MNPNKLCFKLDMEQAELHIIIYIIHISILHTCNVELQIQMLCLFCKSSLQISTSAATFSPKGQYI